MLHNERIIGTTDAYEIHASDTNDSIFVVPLLEFVKAIGGQILDIDQSTPCSEFEQTIYAFDKKHHDLMPARQFTNYGLLGATQSIPRLYCRSYDDLYIDTVQLQSFATESLHIDVSLEIVEN